MPGTAFVDITVVPMDSERTLEHQTVVVSGGRIARIGAAAEVAAPNGAVSIDGRGLYLMPGLADMHAHYESRDCAALFLANGVTTVRVMWGQPHHLKERDRIASGERVGPAIVCAGPIVDGDPPTWPTMTAIGDPAGVGAVLDVQQAAGYDFIKIYNLMAVDVFDALLAAARRRRVQVAGHLPNAVALERALAAGMASIEHTHGLLKELQRDDSPIRGKVIDNYMVTEHVGYTDETKIAAVAALVRRYEGAVCPTLIVNEKMSRLDQAAELRLAPELRYVKAATIAGWDPNKDMRFASRGGAAWDAFAALREVVRISMLLVRALSDAGARLLLGTDAQNPFVVPGFSVHDELDLLVCAGLSPYEALRAGTAAPAEFLGAGDEFGTIAEGKRADLVLADANPLADVSAMRAPAGVMARGQWLPAPVLARMLDEVGAKCAAADGGSQG